MDNPSFLWRHRADFFRHFVQLHFYKFGICNISYDAALISNTIILVSGDHDRKASDEPWQEADQCKDPGQQDYRVQG